MQCCRHFSEDCVDYANVFQLVAVVITSLRYSHYQSVPNWGQVSGSYLLDPKDSLCRYEVCHIVVALAKIVFPMSAFWPVAFRLCCANFPTSGAKLNQIFRNFITFNYKEPKLQFACWRIPTGILGTYEHSKIRCVAKPAQRFGVSCLASKTQTTIKQIRIESVWNKILRHRQSASRKRCFHRNICNQAYVVAGFGSLRALEREFTFYSTKYFFHTNCNLLTLSATILAADMLSTRKVVEFCRWCLWFATKIAFYPFSCELCQHALHFCTCRHFISKDRNCNYLFVSMWHRW